MTYFRELCRYFAMSLLTSPSCLAVDENDDGAGDLQKHPDLGHASGMVDRNPATDNARASFVALGDEPVKNAKE